MVSLHGDSLQKYKITDKEDVLCHFYFKIKNKKSHLSANQLGGNMRIYSVDGLYLKTKALDLLSADKLFEQKLMQKQGLACRENNISAAATVSPPFITSLILVETTIYTPHLFQQFYGSNELW